MADSTPRKPAGGVAAVTVTPAGNLLRAAVAADGRAEAIFRDATQLTALPLAEQRSSYAERLDTDAGPQRMRHTLTLVVGRETFRKAETVARPGSEPKMFRTVDVPMLLDTPEQRAEYVAKAPRNPCARTPSPWSRASNPSTARRPS